MFLLLDDVTEEILSIVSKTITKKQWKSFYTIYLDLYEDELDNVMPAENFDCNEFKINILDAWCAKESDNATTSNLCVIMKTAKHNSFVDQRAIDYLDEQGRFPLNILFIQINFAIINSINNNKVLL